MKDEFMIGIDSGTQSTRAILFDLKGQKVAVGRAKHPGLITDEDGLTVHDYDDVYQGLCDACKDLFRNYTGSPSAIKGIGIASQRATVFFLDKERKQLCRPISWMDRSWRENEKYLTSAEKPQDPWKYFLMNYSRMNWMKRNRPKLFEQVDKYLTTAGYLNYRLTGNLTDTLGNNLGMPVDRENWCLYEDETLFRGMSLERSQIADFIKPGDVVGLISKKAAKETGLPEGCPVVAGAGDKQCEILGSGTLYKGQAYITLGTMTGLNLVDDQYIPDEYQITKHRTYTAAAPGCWNAEASSPRGFWLVSWFRDNFAGDLKNVSGKESIEAVLDREASKIPAGAEGLLTVPDWKSTWDKPYAKGAFIGFDMKHNRPHVFRSLLEGIMMQLKISTDEMCQDTGRKITEIRTGGGGSNSRVAVQAIADVFHIPVRKSEEAETCSLGAAICAAAGTGYFDTIFDAAKEMGGNYTEYLPSEKNHEKYTDLIEKVLKPYYQTNEELLKNLAEISSR